MQPTPEQVVYAVATIVVSGVAGTLWRAFSYIKKLETNIQLLHQCVHHMEERFGEHVEKTRENTKRLFDKIDDLRDMIGAKGGGAR